jgi:hypothetical protein
MPYILIRDGETAKVYVYNNLTHEAADLLESMHTLSVKETHNLFRSDESYDPAIAHQFQQTGMVLDD